MEIIVEIDGEPVEADAAARVTSAREGHFTAMQVRSGGVRGWDRHAARLDAANRETFGAGFPSADVRSLIRHALGDIRDASVRLVVFWDGSAVRHAVTVRPPFLESLGQPTLKSMPYQRPSAHIKRVHNFGHHEAIDAAHAAGFDEALLVTDDGEISEGGITNIGFWDGRHVTWPSAPALAGITRQLIEPLLPSKRGRVFLRDVPSYQGIFVTNARGIAPVSRIDDVPVPIDIELMKVVHAAYESVPWDAI